MNQLLEAVFAGGFNLGLVVVGEVSFASNVSEQMRDITEVWLLRADVAMEWNIACEQSRGHE